MQNSSLFILKYLKHVRKKDGFPGQLSYVIPEKIIGFVKNNPLISDFYITDIGYYPKAMYHFRERVNGSEPYILIYCVGGKPTEIISSKL